MINNDIKYSFNQFELSFLGFCSNLQQKLQAIVPNLPVFVQNSGDFSYITDKKFVQTSNEEIYLKVPRFVIKFEDFQMNQQEDTNQYNKINYHFTDGYNYQAVVRRKAYDVQISGYFVSSNMITALNHMEVMATLMSRDNVYTYEFLGNTMQSAYNITQTSNEVPTIDMGQGGTSNVTVSFQIQLQVHLLVPRIESIIRTDDATINEIDFNVSVSENKLPKIKHKYNDLLDENNTTTYLKYENGEIVQTNTKE